MRTVEKISNNYAHWYCKNNVKILNAISWIFSHDFTAAYNNEIQNPIFLMLQPERLIYELMFVWYAIGLRELNFNDKDLFCILDAEAVVKTCFSSCFK